MYGAQLIEMAQVAEQEHMQAAIMARARAQARRARRRARSGTRRAGVDSVLGAPRHGGGVAPHRRQRTGGPHPVRGLLVRARGVPRPRRRVARAHHRTSEYRAGSSSTSTFGQVPGGNNPRSRYCHAAVWFTHPGTLGP